MLFKLSGLSAALRFADLLGCGLTQIPRDCRLRFTSPTSSAIGLTQSPKIGIAVFRFTQNVFPIHWINPKPFKQTLCVRLAFLLLVCLRKRAFDTASKQKTRHSVTGFAERKGFEPSIRCRIHTFQACAFDHSATAPHTLEAAALGKARAMCKRHTRAPRPLNPTHVRQ